MKRNIFYVLMFVLPMWFVGCDENGDDGYYDGISRVYFGEVDNHHHALGAKPVDVTVYTARIPVCVLGSPASRDMVAKVKIDEALTTAPESMYNPVAAEVTIPKDSVRGWAEVELLRDEIPSNQDTTFTLALQLEASDDFQLGIEECQEFEITFSNYLSEPDWWYIGESIWWGPYHPMKYQKIIELWGGEISFDDYAAQMAQVIYVAQLMYNYFLEHPEYDMEFPENPDFPYVID